MRVLVTAVGGDVAQSIISVIRKRLPEWEIIGSDMMCGHAGEYLVDEFLNSPEANDPNYGDWLNETLDKYSIDLLIPVSDAENLVVSRDGPWKCPVSQPNLEAILVGQDKLETSYFLSRIHLPGPVTFALTDEQPISMPCIVKPRSGRGSKNISVCDSNSDLAFLRLKNPSYIKQELLTPSTEEITCAVYRSKNDQIAVLALKRKLGGGSTVWAEVIHDDEIANHCQKIAEGLNLRGSINVQLIRTADGPRVFEINPRFSSTIAMRDEIGFTDLMWNIQESLEMGDVTFFSPPTGLAIFRVPTVQVVYLE